LRGGLAFGETATIIIQGILQYFDLLATGDIIIQDMIDPVSRTPSEIAERPFSFF
jgi:hypothetical protein